MIQFEVVRAYVDIQMDRAAAFERNGNAASAIATYSEILRFSERVLLERQPPTEHYFAQGMGARACEKLQAVLQSTGRDSEASLVAFQLAEWKAEHDSRVMRYVPAYYREAQWNVLAWSGLQITLAGMAIVILAPIALIGFSYEWARRRVSLEHRGLLDFWASIFADGAPWLPLASSLFLFFLYHPYAKLCGAFLRANQHAPDVESFVTAALVPHAVPETVQFVRDPYSLWFTVTALLCLIIAWLIWRMVIQRKDIA
jgi:hypothetical protein